MTARGEPSAWRGRASIAWGFLLSLLLVLVTAQSRPSALPLPVLQASLASVQGGEFPAIVAGAGKFQRGPEFRHAGDPEDALAPATAPTPALARFRALARVASDAPTAAGENRPPEARAPPLA